MSRSHLGALALFVLALLMAVTPVHAAESYDNCTGFITSIPTTITTQGTWCLKQDLTSSITSGNAIVIATNNVTIDCNDFKIGGLAAGVGTLTNGIFALDRLNATVRHCNIRGFYIGIYFAGSASGGHAIEDNRFDGNTAYGMFIQGDGSVIRRNRVFDTGGSTGSVDAYGIISVNSVDILDNTVSSVVATVGGNGNAFGIDTSSNLDGRIVGNGVRGLLRAGTGHAYGIYNTGSDRLTLRDNDVVGDGIAGGVGLACTVANADARDNVLSHFASAISICTDGGGNSVIP